MFDSAPTPCRFLGLITTLHGCFINGYFVTFRPPLHVQDPTVEVSVYQVPASLHPPLSSAFLVHSRALLLGSSTPSVHCQENSYHQDNKGNHRDGLQVCHPHLIGLLGFLWTVCRLQNRTIGKTTSFLHGNHTRPQRERGLDPAPPRSCFL